MKKYVELMPFLCSSFIGIALNKLRPVYEIKADAAFINILPTFYWMVPEDKNWKLSFKQVSKNLATKSKLKCCLPDQRENKVGLPFNYQIDMMK